MTVTQLASPRHSKLYAQGLIDGVDAALDHLYEDQESPWVYKNTHKGIDHCINLLEHFQEYLKEMNNTGWPGYDDD
jgi:hypothetical protein